MTVESYNKSFIALGMVRQYGEIFNSQDSVLSLRMVGPILPSFKLNISGYVGMAGDYFGAHDAMKFLTKDRDQGTDKNRNCAETFKGG